MKIALVGYGKMGKSIEKIAIERNHNIILIIDQHNPEMLNAEQLKNVDVVIEFSRPEAAFNNIKSCLNAGVPVVCGTTGWLDHKQDIIDLCRKLNGAFMYASNYSLGVNIFFQLNKYLASMMHKFPEYNIRIEEVHHTQKLDAPSGTAITLAEGIMLRNHSIKSWSKGASLSKEILPIHSIREDDVPGIHSIYYENEIDSIEIKHTAFTREGFALGAVTAAEWIKGRKGTFSMQDMLGFDQ